MKISNIRKKNNSNHNISFIIPNYNNGIYLSQCIESLESQTIQPNEIIIIDDCSTDDSVIIIKKFQEKFSNIKLIQNKINKGVSYSRNKGILAAQNNYVCFLDSDDFIDNIKFIEIILKYIKFNRLCFFQYRLCDANGIYIQKYRFTKPHRTSFLSKTRIKTIVCEDVSSVLLPRNYVVNRDCVVAVGMFNEEMDLYEDSDLVCRLLKRVRPFVIGDYGTVYRIKQYGLSHNIPPEKNNLVLTGLKRTYYNLYCRIYLFLKKVFRKVFL